MSPTPLPVLTAREVRDTAAEAVIFGLPLVMMDLVRRAHPTPIQRFMRLGEDARALAPGLATVQRGLIGFSAWVDLSDGPVILTTPDTDGRRLSVAAHDGWGRVFAEFGPGHDGAGQDIALVGPHWCGEVQWCPSVTRAPTDHVWLMAHLLPQSAADRQAALNLARGLRLTSKSACEPTDPEAVMPAVGIPLLDKTAAMSPAAFLHRVAGLLPHNPCRQEDEAIAHRLAQLGLAPGRPFELGEWPPLLTQALREGATQAFDAIRRHPVEPAGHDWIADVGAVARFSQGEERARAVWSNLGALPRDICLRLTATADSDGAPLTSDNRYRLSFPPGSPPAAALWSLETVSASGLLRGRLDHQDIVRVGQGAPIDIVIQAYAPRTRGQNWLASPRGRFTVGLQLLWPRRAALDDAWRPPSLENLGPSRLAGPQGRRASLRSFLPDPHLAFHGDRP